MTTKHAPATRAEQVSNSAQAAGKQSALARALPTNRHFDCMKKCPMDCTKACKRLAYPRLVEALRSLSGRIVDCYSDVPHSIQRLNVEAAALLRELGEDA